VTRLQARQLEASLFNTWQGKKFLFYKESRAEMRSTQSPVWTGDKATGMRSWPITSNWVPSSIMWSHTDTAPIRLHGVHRNKFVFFFLQFRTTCVIPENDTSDGSIDHKKAILVRRDNVQKLMGLTENNWMIRIWSVTGLRSVGAFA
jgi:hypothetical protein